MRFALKMLPAIVSIFLLASHLMLAWGERPNIVLIIADDLGWNDVGFHGGDVDTPNIDALAYNGVILGRHYAQPMCSPSRTALLTGDYPLRHGMQGEPCLAGIADGLPLDVKIMPQYLSKLGYKSHLVGKWHLGYETAAHLPTWRGFDTFFGYLNGFLGYWDCTHFTNTLAGRDIRRNETGAWRDCYGRYLTELLTEEAVKVIQSHPSKDGLFLILSHAAVHTTNMEIERESPPSVKNTTSRGYLRAMVEWLDWSVGEVTTALDKRGLLDNTILVFLSDNGAPTNSSEYSNHGSNWPLRGEKASLHEGGVRTVAALWSPFLGNISRISNQYFHIADWLPTLYAAAGGSPDELESKDGINQWSSLLSSTNGDRKTILLNIDDNENTEAIIVDNWKLIKNVDPKIKLLNDDHYFGESGSWKVYNTEKVNKSIVAQILGPISEGQVLLRRAVTIDEQCPDQVAAMSEDCHSKYCLFDILDDPTECYNVASSHPEVVDRLKLLLEDYRPHLVPTAPKYYDRRASPSNWDDYWTPWTHD